MFMIRSIYDPRCLILCLLATILSGGAASSQQGTTVADPTAFSRQLIVVQTAEWDSLTGTLSCYERGQQRRSTSVGPDSPGGGASTAGRSAKVLRNGKGMEGLQRGSFLSARCTATRPVTPSGTSTCPISRQRPPASAWTTFTRSIITSSSTACRWPRRTGRAANG
jgi:hypothetical protein